METRASYVVVGAFALLIVAGSLLFVLWAAKSAKGDLRTCEVIFNQRVSGLSVGSSVLLEGVRIGQVSAIKVSADNPGRVIVHILVAADAPIRQNSQATLEPQGVTGVSAVAISTGTADSPMLADVQGYVARIPSKPSRLQEIMNSVPSILDSLDNMVNRANDLISPKNTDTFSKLLASVTEITQTLAQNKESIAKGVAGFGNAGESFAVSGKYLETLMSSAQTLVDKDFRNAAQSVGSVATRIDGTMSFMEPGLKRFSHDSLEEFNRVLVETRRLMVHLSSLVQKLESDPRRFLLGNPIPEFSVP